jgi:MFS family permease
MKTAQRRSLFSLYLAYFADYFSWGAAIAFLAIYIGTEKSPFETLYWNPTLALAIAVASFPVGEVIGSPILGDLSDCIGRRRVLNWGLLGSVVSLGLCAIALWHGWFLTFLAGQFLAGFFAGKQGMAQAAIAEIDTGTKVQKLAFLSVLGGIAWITGPYFGSILLENPFIENGGFVWPSLLASAVTAISLVFTYFFFEDTYCPKMANFSTAKFVKGMGEPFLLAFRERLYVLFLLNLLGWYLVTVSTSYFLIQKFNLTNAELALFDNYLALWFTMGGILGTTWVLYRYRARKVLFWLQIAGSLALFSLFGLDKIEEFWIYFAIPAFTEALIYPAYQTILSDHTSDQSQGKIFGLINATNGICQVSAGWILTLLPPDYVGTPILLSALLFLGSGVFIPVAMRKKGTVHYRDQLFTQ